MLLFKYCNREWIPVHHFLASYRQLSERRKWPQPAQPLSAGYCGSPSESRGLPCWRGCWLSPGTSSAGTPVRPWTSHTWKEDERGGITSFWKEKSSFLLKNRNIYRYPTLGFGKVDLLSPVFLFLLISDSWCVPSEEDASLVVGGEETTLYQGEVAEVFCQQLHPSLSPTWCSASLGQQREEMWHSYLQYLRSTWCNCSIWKYSLTCIRLQIKESHIKHMLMWSMRVLYLS